MDGMMNTKEVARLVDRSVQTIHKWVRAGKIPYRRFNGRLYFMPDEIRAWIDGMPGLALQSEGDGDGAGSRES